MGVPKQPPAPVDHFGVKLSQVFQDLHATACDQNRATWVPKWSNLRTCLYIFVEKTWFHHRTNMKKEGKHDETMLKQWYYIETCISLRSLSWCSAGSMWGDRVSESSKKSTLMLEVKLASDCPCRAANGLWIGRVQWMEQTMISRYCISYHDIIWYPLISTLLNRIRFLICCPSSASNGSVSIQLVWCARRLSTRCAFCAGPGPAASSKTSKKSKIFWKHSHTPSIFALLVILL